MTLRTTGRRRLLGVGAGLLFLLAAACRDEGGGEASREPARTRAGGAGAEGSPGSIEPLLERLPDTTAPKTAVRYLNAQIRGLEAKMTSAPKAGRRARLVAYLLQRAQFLGRLEDYGRALEVAGAYVSAHPEDGAAYLARARARASLHLFAEARRDLERARELGAEDSALDALDASLLLATGEAERAAERRAGLTEELEVSQRFAEEAIATARAGDVAHADRRFRRALEEFRGTSPWALSWTLFQYGLLWEREGRHAKARELYERGYERLPGYAALATHLAGALKKTGDRARAVEILEPLLESSTDPEVRAKLGELRRAGGETERAEALIEEARAGYEELLEAHPRAFADHAARFYLGAGEDPARALELARKNLENRETDRAYQLLLDAADAAGLDAGAACAIADEALEAREEPSAYLLFAAARAYRGCGRADRADELLARADEAARAR